MSRVQIPLPAPKTKIIENRTFRFPEEVSKIIDGIVGGWKRDFLLPLARASFELAEIFHRGENFPLNLQTVLPYIYYFFPRTFSSALFVLSSVEDIIRDILNRRMNDKRDLIFIDLSAGVCSASSAFIYLLDFIARENKILQDLKIRLVVQDISDVALDFGLKILHQISKNVPFKFEFEKMVLDASRINIKKEIGENPDIAVLSFSLYDIFHTDVEAMIVWSDKVLKSVSDYGIFVLIEPALKKRNSLFIMKIRDALREYVVAPCTHYDDCPILKIQDDWCHFGTKWIPPLSLSRGMSLIGGRVPEINFSYLILSKNKEFSRWVNFHRVVSHRLEEKGRIRFWTCSSSGKNLFQILKKNISDKNSDIEYVQSGDVVFIDGVKSRDNFYEFEGNSNLKIINSLFSLKFFER